mgnify:CR=1 FL=1
MFTGKDEEAVLNEAERGEDHALKAYKEAIEKINKHNLLGIRDLVERQYHGVQRNHDQVKALRVVDLVIDWRPALATITGLHRQAKLQTHHSIKTYSDQGHLKHFRYLKRHHFASGNLDSCFERIRFHWRNQNSFLCSK